MIFTKELIPSIFFNGKKFSNIFLKRRLQLENRKKCLNQRIKKYNEILFWIREQDNILASKKDILKNIEKTFEEAYRCQGLDEGKIFYHLSTNY